MEKAFAALPALAFISLGVLSATSQQSTISLNMPSKTFSEYSTDGEHFLPLGASQHFNAHDGALTLRTRLPEAYPFPIQMHMRLDHMVHGRISIKSTPVEGALVTLSIPEKEAFH